MTGLYAGRRHSASRAILAGAVAALLFTVGVSAGQLATDDNPALTTQSSTARPAQVSSGPWADALTVTPKTVAPDAAGRFLTIVRFVDQPLASYDGGVTGLAATSTRVTGEARLDARSPAALDYLQYLTQRQATHAADMARVLGRQVELEQQYLGALNGAAVRLTLDEARRLRDMDFVINVHLDEERELETDVGPGHIGAPAVWFGQTSSMVATRGEGVIIGVLDTGINFSHPSFAGTDGDGYAHTNPYGAGVYLGWCASNPGHCNDKVIAAYSFNPVGGSPIDNNNHGSHVASTAAGNIHVADISVGGDNYLLEISGVAPRANIVAYRVCAPSCPTTASVQAINSAIVNDQVDVINYSISGNDFPWDDPVDLAFLDAFNAGIFVSASAGNDGAGANTVAKTGPWNAAVAASTHRRAIGNTLDVTGPTTPAELQAVLAVPGIGMVIGSDIVGELRFNGGNPLGCTAHPAGFFNGSIALLSRGGCIFSEKINNAVNAGATHVVVFNNFGGPPIVMGGVSGLTPSVMIDNVTGITLRDYVQDNAGTMIRLNAGTALFENVGWEDVVAGFSSRGPSQYDLLAPTFTAPGVNILAAGFDGANAYTFLQGTSMSSPHAAGAAALMRALHPDWSPAEIRSALALSAVPDVLTKEDGVTPADPFDQGSGLLNLEAAGRSSLVMDETGANFAAANPATGGDPRTLNLPHLVDQSCAGTCSWTRTVTNVGAETLNYDAAGTGPAGMAITVTPSSFTLSPNQSVALFIEVDVDTSQVAPNSWAFGSVEIVPQEISPFDFIEIGEAYDRSGTWTAKTHDISALAGQDVCLAFRLEGADTHAWFIDDIQVTSSSGTHLDESFSGEAFPPAGWSAFQLGAPAQREWMRTTVSSNSGPASAWHNWAGSAFQDDGWLVTPRITLGANPVLSYFDRMTFLGFYTYSGVWASTGNCDPTVIAEASTARLPVAIIPRTDAEISLGPDSLTVALVPGQSASDTLMISNLGGVDLNWIITETPLASVMLELSETHRLPALEPRGDAGLSSAIPSLQGIERELQHFQAPAGPGASYELVLDDGVGENAVGLTNGGEILWLNRFTPSPLDFPITLDQVQVMFGYPGSAAGINVGELVDIYLYADADSNPTNGAVHVASLNGQAVQAVDGVNWSTFALAEPVEFSGPGDILVAVVNRTAGLTSGTFPAVIDQTPPSQQRSWIGFGAVPGDPPALPMPTFGLIDNVAFVGNWLIRAQGVSNGPCVSPEDVSWLSVDPASGITGPGDTSLVTISFDSTGLAIGTYQAALCVSSDDPDAPLIGLPVTLIVVDDEIFLDRFEQ